MDDSVEGCGSDGGEGADEGGEVEVGVKAVGGNWMARVR